MSIRLEVADFIARVTIDRPERMNAIDRASEEALERIWVEIESRDDIRCIVLTGGGDHQREKQSNHVVDSSRSVTCSNKRAFALWTSGPQ